jgi:predicted nucleic acid-binding protein
VESARGVLTALRALEGHRFLADDVSIADPDVPAIVGHRQVADAHLIALARRRGTRVVTFDAGVLALGGAHDVDLLSAL